MRTRIITHHSVHNHGALLQLYALIKVLSKYDSTVCALDYTKNLDFLASCASLKYNISFKSIPFYLEYLKEKGLKRTLFNVGKKEILDRFKKENHMVGEYYSRIKDLDAVFIGSDEVFSIEPGLNAFFWGMGVPARNIFAYAGCFGPTDFNFIKAKNAEEFIKAGIRQFDKISVRDLNSQKIICELGGNFSEQVCDPVILYGYNQEKDNFSRPMQEKYILVYAYDENMNDSSEIEYIKGYARSNNLKIVTAGFYHEWCDKSINVDPIQLMEWVANAEYVITDTFHGTVMSLIMNTQFATKIRGNRNKLGFLLFEYGMESREIKDFKNLADVLKPQIDYEKVNALLAQKKEQGIQFIENCMSIVKNEK